MTHNADSYLGDRSQCHPCKQESFKRTELGDELILDVMLQKPHYNQAEIGENQEGLDPRQGGQRIHKVGEGLDNLEALIDLGKLLRWHYRLGHLSFKRIKLLVTLGILPRRLVLAVIPKCAGCLCGAIWEDFRGDEEGSIPNRHKRLHMLVNTWLGINSNPIGQGWPDS